MSKKSFISSPNQTKDNPINQIHSIINIISNKNNKDKLKNKDKKEIDSHRTKFFNTSKNSNTYININENNILKTNTLAYNSKTRENYKDLIKSTDFYCDKKNSISSIFDQKKLIMRNDDTNLSLKNN